MSESYDMKMDLNDMNVFFCKNDIEDFYEIVKNKDLENILQDDDEDTLLQTSEVKQVKLINTLPKKRISNSQISESPLKHRKIEIKHKFKKSHADNQISFHNDIVKRNENFLTQTLSKNSGDLSQQKRDVVKDFSNSAKPLNRTTWNILRNLNIESNKYLHQYLDTNKERVLLAGCQSGTTETIRFDTFVNMKSNNSSPKKSPQKTEEIINKETIKKKYFKKPAAKKNSLLKSMNINFKPGPLCRKPVLNEFSNKSGLGDVQLVKLPSVGLEIIPKIGTSLDSNVCKYLKEVRSKDGAVDSAWANFASSLAPGFTEQQLNENASHVFVIPYENNRSKILVRKDLDETNHIIPKYNPVNKLSNYFIDLDTHLPLLNNYEAKDDTENDVKSVLIDLLSTVSIGEIQDEICQIDPDIIVKEDKQSPVLKEKIVNKPSNKKHVNELKKLNVTLIEIDTETPNKDICTEDHCKLGCICSSLKSIYLLNEHCGLPECMFNCKCDIDTNTSENGGAQANSDISHSAVLNIHYQMNRNLAKEEIKFRRTVIKSNDQTIVLGARRRGVRLPKKFEDYRSLPLYETNDTSDDERIYSKARVLLPKLPQLDKCEPWCMIHQLYRCFCKDLFVNGKEHALNKHKKKSNKILYNKNSKENDAIIPKTLHIENPLPYITHIQSLANHNKNNIGFSSKKNEGSLKTVPKCKESPSEEKSSIIPINNNISKLDSFQPPDSILPSLSYFKLGIKIPKDLEIIELRTEPIPIVDNSNETKNTENKSIVNDGGIEDVICTTKAKPKEPNIIIKDGQNKISKDETNIMNIIKNISDIKNSHSYKFETQIVAPSPGQHIVISWCNLIAQLLLKKIYIWLTPESPYNQYITVGNILLSTRKLINVITAHKSLIKKHPPFVDDIQNLKHSANTYLILEGNDYAWQLKAHIINNNANMPVPKLKSILPNKETPSDTNYLCKLLKSENNVSRIKNLGARWFKMNISDYYDEIEIKSKNFLIKRHHILNAIRIADATKEIIKLTPLENEQFGFGLYFVPTHFNVFYLGPYALDENTDIKTNSKCIRIPKKWGVWLKSELKLIELLNVSQNNRSNYKKVDFNGEFSREFRRNPNIRTDSKNLILCIKGIWKMYRNIVGDNTPSTAILKNTITSLTSLYKTPMQKKSMPNKIVSNINDKKIGNNIQLKSILTPNSIKKVITSDAAKTADDDLKILPAQEEIFEISDSD